MCFVVDIGMCCSHVKHDEGVSLLEFSGRGICGQWRGTGVMCLTSSLSRTPRFYQMWGGGGFMTLNMNLGSSMIGSIRQLPAGASCLVQPNESASIKSI